MTGGSTPVSFSPSKGKSTARIPWLASGCSTSGLAVAPLNPSSSNQEGEPCAPPSGEIGSLVSLLSSSATIGGGTARVTSEPTFAITMGIATITAIAVVLVGDHDA